MIIYAPKVGQDVTPYGLAGLCKYCSSLQPPSSEKMMQATLAQFRQIARRYLPKDINLYSCLRRTSKSLGNLTCDSLTLCTLTVHHQSTHTNYYWHCLHQFSNFFLCTATVRRIKWDFTGNYIRFSQIFVVCVSYWKLMVL